MKKIPFESQSLESGESIMFVKDLEVSEIRFKHATKEIFVVYAGAPKYVEQELQDATWQAVKKLVLAEGGHWSNKKDGIEFLLEVTL